MCVRVRVCGASVGNVFADVCVLSVALHMCHKFAHVGMRAFDWCVCVCVCMLGMCVRVYVGDVCVCVCV